MFIVLPSGRLESASRQHEKSVRTFLRIAVTWCVADHILWTIFVLVLIVDDNSRFIFDVSMSGPMLKFICNAENASKSPYRVSPHQKTHGQA